MSVPCPIRLEAQDAALSRPKQGFESPMGHLIPQAFRTWGMSVSTALTKLLLVSFISSTVTFLCHRYRSRAKPRVRPLEMTKFGYALVMASLFLTLPKNTVSLNSVFIRF